MVIQKISMILTTTKFISELSSHQHIVFQHRNLPT